MSAGRADSHDTPRQVPPNASTTLSLPAKAITIRKNGIEFFSSQPVAPWTEVTLAIESSIEKKKVTCRGVVVACDGNRHKGYQVSLLFLGLTAPVQRRLESLALSHLG
jgi:hypothetical protein